MKSKKQTRTNADALIERAALGPRAADPSAAALVELRKVLEYNDGAPMHKRVTVAAALEMLGSLGWNGGARALNGVCQRRLNRRSYGTP